jgi:hypothetical protein
VKDRQRLDWILQTIRAILLGTVLMSGECGDWATLFLVNRWTQMFLISINELVALKIFSTTLSSAIFRQLKRVIA